MYCRTKNIITLLYFYSFLYALLQYEKGIHYNYEYYIDVLCTSDSFMYIHGNFDVDVVITWVNGSDPLWQEKFLKDAHKNQIHIKKATFQSRYINVDELRYAIRSVETHLPWVRRIFIVTAGQVPSWLNESLIIKSPNFKEKYSSYYTSGQSNSYTFDRKGNNSGSYISNSALTSENSLPNHHITIQIVDQSEIFPDDASLPSYNSNAIEVSLFKIKDLSEHFIYMNDDMFIGQNLNRSYFFSDNGKPIFPILKMNWFQPYLRFKLINYTKKKYDMAAYQYKSVYLRTVAISEKFFGKKQFGKYSHGPIPLTKSIIQGVYDNFPDEVKRTAYSQFRHYTNILLQQISILYGLGTGNAYYNIVDKSIYIALENEYQVKKVFQKLKHNKLPPIFCINEVKKYREKMKKFLNLFMPKPSSFEKIEN